ELVAACDQEYRQVGTSLAHQALQIEAVHAGHTNVRDQAIDIWQSIAIEQGLGRRECPHRVARRLEKLLERFEQARGIIDDRDQGLRGGHAHELPERLE